MPTALMTSTEYAAAVTAHKATLEKEGRILAALDDLHTAFGGLTEAQHNTFANAEYKHDEAAKALVKLGVLAVTWEQFNRMHDK